MAGRLVRVRDICTSKPVAHPPAPQYGVLYYQLQKAFVYCPIYKAASTSVLHWLLKMKGVDAGRAVKITKRQISDIARQHYPSLDYPAADELLKSSKIRFMIVRHPFERILSAYRDKLENSTAGPEHGTVHFYQKYGRKIVEKYRIAKSSKIEPTFEEFVHYLIDTDLSLYADDHWIPYYLFCTPCSIDYDVIIHFETIQEDLRMLLDLIGDNSGPEKVHSNSPKRSSYYDGLSRDLIVKLHEKYKVDFEMFGYSIDAYI